MDESATPPARPLLDGIYDFVWRPANLKVFIGTAFCLTLVAGFACGFYALVEFIAGLPQETEKFGYFMIGVRAGAHIFAGLVFLSFLSSLFPSACFMRIIESTAAGDERVQWNQGVWFDFVKDFFFLVWITFCSAAVPGIVLGIASLFLPLPALVWWILLATATLLVFPMFILSTLMANAAWHLLHVRLVERLLQEPAAAVALYLNTFAFGLPCLLLAFWMIPGLHWGAVLIAGPVWAMYWLSFARVLGRVGWVVTEEKTKPRRRKKRVRFEDEAEEEERMPRRSRK